jgi:RNA polymerase sigma-70 factor, ECF subfamily
MELLRAARKGDRSAFLEVFEAHHEPLFRFACRLTGSPADAEQIVQESFLALLARDCPYDPRQYSLRTWLLGDVRNRAIGRPQREADQPVGAAVNHLPDNIREVLILAHYEQLPQAEIARALGIGLSSVKACLQRGRADLKDLLAARRR